VADRRLEGDDRWRSIGDPTYDAYLRSELEAANELLVGQGVAVVWLTAPYVDTGKEMQPPPSEPLPESDPARMDALNDMIRSLADAREGVVVVDLAGHLAALPAAEDEHLRPDGVHFTPETAVEIAQDWLGEELHAATTRERAPDATGGSTGDSTGGS
jgi:lysophospholipase L1-like esterase